MYSPSFVTSQRGGQDWQIFAAKHEEVHQGIRAAWCPVGFRLERHVYGRGRPLDMQVVTHTSSQLKIGP